MFIYTVKWNKKLALAIIIALALLLCLLIVLSHVIGAEQSGGTQKLRTNAQRIEFLESLGWEVSEEPIDEKVIVIPKEFSNVYTEYNKLQIAQGYDLSQYCGLEATIYTYDIYNYSGYSGQVVAELYILNHEIIGGDVHSLSLDGFMHGLRRMG